LARRLRKLADDAGTWFIVNDSPWIARQCCADGVHLGQEDLQITSVTAAKAILGASAVIGVSTHSLEQALDAERRGAGYIAVGPVFATATKPDVKPVGLDLVTEVTMRVRTPVFAIGGINRGNAGQVIRAGARAVAVVSDILCAEDVTNATLELKKMLDI
jgi:thiamine-phosphate pyrophosphorylase